MSSQTESIPFRVDVRRIIDVLARQIYQSPLALLRENSQNAFDAILLRRHLGQTFAPSIEVSITPDLIRVHDNGIGMTPDELRRNFWSAGSSGKNTAEARAAGVVGTFGIGAMANFGIAQSLEVVTESARTAERTSSMANRDTLSVTEECILVEQKISEHSPGTTVSARMAAPVRINVDEAVAYLRDFVRFVSIPVIVNGHLESQHDLGEAVPRPSNAWFSGTSRSQLTSALTATSEVGVLQTGELWLQLLDIELSGRPFPGQMILRQGAGQVRTFRSGFGLARVAVGSEYNLGGVAESPLFVPTAGREALSTESIQLLQSVVTEVARYLSEVLGQRPESDNNTDFMRWAIHHNRIDLCGNILIRTEPDSKRRSLKELAVLSRGEALNLYGGNDPSIVSAFASEERPLLILSTSQPRRQCETQYLSAHARVTPVADAPTVLGRKAADQLSLAEGALVFRLTNVLESDYFLRARVEMGQVSHQVPVVIEKRPQGVTVVLNTGSDSVRVLVKLYDSDLPAFGSMVKDFARSVLFPRIADIVPSSTREGAEAFLKTIRQPRDPFEYEATDLGNLADIWADYLEGRLTLSEAAQRSSVVASGSIQIVDTSQSRQIRDVVSDVLSNEQLLAAALSDADPLEALPAIARLETEARAKLLTIPSDQPALKGYRVFLAVTDRVRREKGDFFLNPHRTAVVWGGQKAVFVFQHHSGEFGLYYELQTGRAISEEAGGRAFPTCTIVFQDTAFIPIPEEIQKAFIPEQGERKRFDVRCDLLYSEIGGDRGGDRVVQSGI